MTAEREQHLQAFLKMAGWADAQRNVLAGDASNRRYDRLRHPDLGKAVLMDAPPEKGEDTRPFINIATHLRQAGLSAPEIFARDTTNGFLIIEDLGDDLFARVLEKNPGPELQLYLAATDALYTAQQAEPPANLLPYGPKEMADTALLAADWYLTYAVENPPDIREEFRLRIADLLHRTLTGPPVLVQRDYHAENLLWLPDRDGDRRVGLLDFQDAMMGDAAYDLASLLKDARRDVDPSVQHQCIEHFIRVSQSDKQQFGARYAVCSAQRNLRIIGVFTRLCVRDGKGHYPDMLPRVWRNLMDDLTHPDLAEFGQWVRQVLPAPTPDIVARIKAANA